MKVIHLGGGEAKKKDCLTVWWLGPGASTAGGWDLVPAQGTKIPQAMWLCQGWVGRLKQFNLKIKPHLASWCIYSSPDF